MKKSFYIILIFFLSTILLYSSFQLWQLFTDEWKVQKQFEALTKQTERPKAEPLEWSVFDQYGTLFEQNPDMIGWISIEGTMINHPVMQTPDHPDYYLKRNFEKQYSDYGVPYMTENCDIDPQSNNITIYGHNMKNGKMFGALEGYKSEAFYRDHTTVGFDTRIGFGVYEIIAAFKVNPADFKYNLFVNTTDSAEFDSYVRQCKKLSFYDTGVTAVYGDKLITLSTCEYSGQDSRLVIVGRKV